MHASNKGIFYTNLNYCYCFGTQVFVTKWNTPSQPKNCQFVVLLQKNLSSLGWEENVHIGLQGNSFFKNLHVCLSFLMCYRVGNLQRERLFVSCFREFRDTEHSAGLWGWSFWCFMSWQKPQARETHRDKGGEMKREIDPFIDNLSIHWL